MKMLIAFKNFSGSITQVTLVGAFVLMASACSPAEIPPPPSSELSSASSKSTKTKNVDDEEPEDEESADAVAAEGEDTPLQLGAQIGDEQMKKAVADCTKKGNFYSRTNGGKCTTHKLANVECTVEGIKKDLSAANRKLFNDRLSSTDYEGYVIDQCVACDGKKTEEDVCLKKDGTVVKGVRIFFAKLNDSVVDVKFQTIEQK
jgi:hypothetical protein